MPRLCPDGCAKERFGFGKLAAPEQEQAESVVVSKIRRIAPQRFAVVVLRFTCGMAVLLQVQASQIKSLSRLYPRRFRNGRRWFGKGFGLLRFRRVIHELLARRAKHDKAEVSRFGTPGQRGLRYEGLLWPQVDPVFPNEFATVQ